MNLSAGGGGYRFRPRSGAADGAGGVLDVALDGAPYPVQFARAGGKGVLTLAEWDVDFALEPPAKGETVDYGGQLPKTSG